MKYNTVVIGGGAAGLDAAASCARLGLSVLLLEAMYTGGMALKVKNVPDFPGFPDGISGEELTDRMEKAAVAAGVRILHERVTDMELSEKTKSITTDRGAYEADTVIIACGARVREMGLENERALTGLGIFHAVAEGKRAIEGKKAAVWGSGEEACNFALELAEICIAVYLICPEERLNAGKRLIERIRNTPKIKLYENSLIAGVNEGMFLLESMTVVGKETMEIDSMPVEAVFVSPELEPDSDVLLGHVRMTDEGAVIVNGDMATETEGVYAVGAVRSGSAKTIPDAVADARRAALAVNAYIIGN